MFAVMWMVLLLVTMGVAAVRVGAEPRDRTVTEPDVARKVRVGSPVDAAGTQRRDTVEGRNGLASRSLDVSGSVTVLYRNHSAAYWAWRYRTRTQQLQAARAQVKRRWHPTVDYALRLASNVYGVPYTELRNVAWCESRFYPFARNGQYAGIFQMHWSPFGFSPYDPIASALSAAQTVVRDGGWHQWECRP